MYYVGHSWYCVDLKAEELEKQSTGYVLLCGTTKDGDTIEECGSLTKLTYDIKPILPRCWAGISRVFVELGASTMLDTMALGQHLLYGRPILNLGFLRLLGFFSKYRCMISKGSLYKQVSVRPPGILDHQIGLFHILHKPRTICLVVFYVNC